MRPFSTMRLFTLLLLLPLAVQAITVSTSFENYSGTLAEDGTISHFIEVGYSSPEPIRSLTLSYYVPTRAYNVTWHGDRGSITNANMTTYNSYYQLLHLSINFGVDESEYALNLSYNTAPDIRAYGRLVRATVCPFTTNVTSRITLPEGGVYLSSTPDMDFAGSPPSAELTIYDCISLVYLRQTGTGYTLSSIGKNYLLVHTSQSSLRNVSQDITMAASFIPRIESELGLPFPFKHMAYVILPLQSTDILPWAAGEYHAPGVVLVRPNATTYALAETIVHETTHAFNSQIPHVQGADNWFDEGMADYMEHQAFLEAGDYEEALFPENNPRAQTHLSDLRYYYGNNYTFMMEWDPTNSAYDEWRNFGYAYSQLVIRAYVDEFGSGALRSTYACLVVHGNSVIPQQEFTDLLTGCMSNSSGGADPEEFLNPGKSLLGDEGAFADYIDRIGSSAFIAVEPDHTPTPPVTPTPSPGGSVTPTPSPGGSVTPTPTETPSPTPIPTPEETAIPTPGETPPPHPTPTPVQPPAPCCLAYIAFLVLPLLAASAASRRGRAA
jgi:hypothetical protein